MLWLCCGCGCAVLYCGCVLWLCYMLCCGCVAVAAVLVADLCCAVAVLWLQGCAVLWLCFLQSNMLWLWLTLCCISSIALQHSTALHSTQHRSTAQA